MKALVVLTAAAMVLCSCSARKTTTLAGKWQLTEELIDIGDGKGTFRPTDSEQVIEFLADGTFTSTISLCPMPGPDAGQGNGTYSVEKMILTPGNCAETGRSIPLELSGEDLILHLPCVEPCQQKYVRVD